MNRSIPPGYLQLRTVAKLRNRSIDFLLPLAKAGRIPQAIYSPQTKHYYVPIHFCIQLN